MIRPDDSGRVAARPSQSIRSVLKEISGDHWPALRASLAWSIAASLAQAASYALLIPLLSGHGSRGILLGLFAALVVVEALMRRRELGFSYDRFADVIEDLRLRLGQKLRTMPMQALQRKATGDLAAILGSNVTDTVMAISAVGTLFCQFVTVPTVLVIAFVAADWRLALVLLVTIPFAIPFVSRLRSLAGEGYAEATRADGLSAAAVVEYVQGLPVFKAYGRTGGAAARLHEVFRHQDRVLSTIQRDITVPSILAAGFVQLGIVAVAAIGCAAALGTTLDPMVLIAVMAAAIRFAEPLVTAAAMTLAFEYARAGLVRIDDVLSTPSIPETPHRRAPGNSTIVFEGVTFTYDESMFPALVDVDCTIPEHRLTALVGPSGGGKTTLTRLITRYADPQAGSIQLGGVPLPEVEALARRVAVVFQDVYLFDDTIEANIRFGRPVATPEQVIEAARAAHCHDFIRALPHGYRTTVGEIGQRISGGERQRISIARAILADAPIIILDEPTSALDPESELAVQAAIDRLVEHKTVIVIAHRLSTIVAADQILVLDNGRIVERGTHASLLTAGNRYAAMWNA